MDTSNLDVKLKALMDVKSLTECGQCPLLKGELDGRF